MRSDKIMVMSYVVSLFGPHCSSHVADVARPALAAPGTSTATTSKQRRELRCLGTNRLLERSKTKYELSAVGYGSCCSSHCPPVRGANFNWFTISRCAWATACAASRVINIIVRPNNYSYTALVLQWVYLATRSKDLLEYLFYSRDFCAVRSSYAKLS